MAGDYLPKADPEFDGFQGMFVAYATANAATLGLSPAEVAELTDAQWNWVADYPAHLAAQAAAASAVAKKNSSRKMLVNAIRRAAQKVQGNPATTDGQRASLGLTIPSGRSKVPPPSTRPLLSADTSNRLQIGLRWRDEATPGRRAKPDRVFGIEIHVKVGGPAPTDLGECRFLALATGGSFVAPFEGEDAGKTAYFIARWVNAKGEAGPISETVAATVPG